MTCRKVSVSRGNSKMGRVMSVSLSPVLSCGKSLPCFKGCYAAKLARLRPVVRDAWLGNWHFAMSDRDGYMDAVRAAIAAKPPGLFRWHVAGDIPDYAYLGGMRWVAGCFPDVRMLAFTKKYDLLRLMRREKRALPPNLTVIVSAWPGLYLPPDIRHNFPVAWMRDPEKPDRRIPADALECGGGCETCAACWGMEPGKSVVFGRH